ncbi:hypothetical protein NCG89_06665 [Spongiibacter taiwanensis]|uniref:hypothetical protein n=1 Tax=Spongiibacter taiwanensis TaxID=1748242 RepID=UPI002034B4EB|nr:hypothetical protein [Spongiibacter taiwanensis]USA44450.1 hypothetical protein NCG89_06665 [Spongiibacter taiwanensis]
MKQTFKNVVAATALTVAGMGVANAQVPALPVGALGDLAGVLDLGSFDLLAVGDLASLADLGALGDLGGFADLGGGDLLALVPLDGLGGLSGVLDLGGGLSLDGGLGGGGDLLALIPLDGLGGLGGGAGGLEGIPVLGPVLDLVLNGDFVEKLLPSPKIDQLAGGGASLLLELVPGVIANPQSVLGTVNELGLNAGVAAAPVLTVLMENPAGLLDYFQGGGTILFEAINGTGGNSIVPGIPLLSMPLNL